MNRIFYLLAFIFSIHSAHAQAWKQVANFPGDGRASSSTFSFSDYGFIGLGYDGEEFNRSFYAYDPVYDSWNAVSSMGGVGGGGLDRNVAAAFTIGTKGYVGTGQGTAAFLNDFWEYNYLTDVWTPKSAFAGTARRSSIGFSISGKGYIGLGQDATGYKKDLWQYDTTSNTWTQKADFGGTARRLAVVMVIGNKAYAGTGDDGAFTNDFWMYDPPSNSWFLKDDFPGSPRYGATAFTLNEKGYLACGYDTTLSNQTDFWEYDATTDTWTHLADFPGGRRANAVAFTVDTLAFFGMGYDTSFYYDVWLWGDTTKIIPEDTTHDTTDAIFQTDYLTTDISIFPNPVFESAIISINENGIREENIRIYDLNGNDVTGNCMIRFISSGIKQSEFQIEQFDLQNGTYFIRIDTGKFSATRKFMIFE